MFLKTRLNATANDKSFRFGKFSFEKKGETGQYIDVEITPRKNDKEEGRDDPETS
jgi:hypothetical protein